MGEGGFVVMGFQAQQGIKFAIGVQLGHVVEPANVEIVDKDLRHCAAVAALHHFHHQIPVQIHADFLIFDPLALQQGLGAHAIGAHGG